MAITKTLPPHTGGSATLNSSGTGLVDMEVPTLQTWRVTKWAVSTTTNVKEPTAAVYIGAESPANLIDSTYTGSGDASDENQVVMPGQHILCRWTGGDVGAVATLSIFGEVTS